MKNCLLYSNSLWDNYKDLEEAKAEIGDLISFNKGYESIEDITDEDIYDDFYEMTNIHYDEVVDELESHFKHLKKDLTQFLIIADIERWDGRYAGGKIVQSIRNVIETVNNNEYNCFSIGIEDNTLVLRGSHHDGNNEFKVFAITNKGEIWVNNNPCESDREIHSHSMNTKGYVRKLFTGKWKLN